MLEITYTAAAIKSIKRQPAKRRVRVLAMIRSIAADPFASKTTRDPIKGRKDSFRQRLGAWGYEVVVCPLDQFILAGGSAKCLALRLAHPTDVGTQPRPPSELRDCTVELRGHLLDRGVMNTVLDRVTDGGGSFEIEAFQAGLRHDQDSWSRLRVVAPSPGRLDAILARLLPLGVDIADEATDARLEPVVQAGVAPTDFYGTTIFPTEFVESRGPVLLV